MTDTRATTYDEVPYESHPFPQTHPDRLATVATLLGMRPRAIDKCRVLELGCAAGGNIVPMALTLPESTFVGIDLSGVQVAEGQKTVDALGLKNIQLKQMSILDVDRAFGQFDYILCHGVFSWVPHEVQEKILEICVQNLSANGVAYVSYNTYPGWHMRGMIRDMMCYHSKHFSVAQMRVRQARNLLDFMAKSVAKQESPFSMLLRSELEVLRGSRDAYLFHDHLEEVNDPLYFYQFAERAAAKGLQYLGEADFHVMMPGNFPPEIESVLQMVSPDHIHMEQYMDFLRNRMFRQTLLCHRIIPRNTNLRAEQLTAFHVASAARPVSASIDVSSTETELFETPDSVGVRTADPITKAALVVLAERWPDAIEFPALVSTARSHLNAGARDPANDAKALGLFLLSAYASAANSLVELHVHPPRFAVNVAARPVASALARLQAVSGPYVTSLRHQSVGLDEFARRLLPLLDGTRDRNALEEAVTALVAAGDLAVERDGKPLEDAAGIEEAVTQGLDEQLPRLARCALRSA